MLKNVAGQKVGVQMITASDGSEFTSTVTVYVTIDAGTQAIGTVSAGVCTHEGHGYFTYAPSQAETNGTLNAYTFVGSGAVTKSVQVYTDLETFIDERTDQADLDFAAMQADVDAILAKTTNLPVNPAATTDIPSAAAIATAVWGLTVEGSYTAIQFLRGIASSAMGKASGMATTTAVLRDVSDSKARITATVDEDGNRSAVTVDLT